VLRPQQLFTQDGRMIGLMIFGAIGLWLVIAITLGVVLPKWFGLKSYFRWIASVILIPLFALAPVYDEVLAYPKMRQLCKQAEEDIWYDKTAAGKEIKRYADIIKRENIEIGNNIIAHRETYVSGMTEEGTPVIRYSIISTSGGFLKFPAGSSGNQMPLILPSECPSIAKSRSLLESIRSDLKLQYIN
jgi:hypothetical protein